MLETVELLTLDDPVAAPSGLVYSTNPRTAEAAAGKYFVKGPGQEVVFAELAGCLLASAVGLKVPKAAVCCFGGSSYCGTPEVADLGRNIEPLLRAPSRVINFSDIFSVIAVDVWLANTDRNMGNVLGRSIGKGQVELVMIDFEKSVALRRDPTVSCALVPAKKLWPTEELGKLLRARRPLQPPTVMMGKIKAFVSQKSDVAKIVDAAAAVCPEVSWAPNTIDVLVSRGNNLPGLVGEVWAL